MISIVLKCLTRFTGQYQEIPIPGGGLYYYGARWYDAFSGRFISADTIVPDAGNPQDLNRYSYVRNNPVKYTDPTGHTPACMSMGHPLATVACQLVDAAVKYGPRLVTTIGSFFTVTAFHGSEHNTPHVTRPVAVSTHESDPQPYFQPRTILELPLEAPVTDIWITRPFDSSTTVSSNVVGGGFSLSSQASVQDLIYAATHEVYVVRDAQGDVIYVGRTGQGLRERERQHRQEPGREGWRLETYESGLSVDEARDLEQELITRYGLNNLENKRNEIAPSKWSGWLKSLFEQMGGN